MKKKHIQYRSGLLIGLLSLNILSSCVNTGRQLGVTDRPSTIIDIERPTGEGRLQELMAKYNEQIIKPYKDPWYKSKRCIYSSGATVGVGVILAGVTGLCCYYYLWLSGSSPVEGTMMNTTIPSIL